MNNEGHDEITCGCHGCIFPAKFTVNADGVSVDTCFEHLAPEIEDQLETLPGAIEVTLVECITAR